MLSLVNAAMELARKYPTATAADIMPSRKQVKSRLMGGDLRRSDMVLMNSKVSQGQMPASGKTSAECLLEQWKLASYP